jgi:hypothetical protein
VHSPLCIIILKTLRCKGKNILIIKSLSFFSTAFVQNIFHSDKYLASYIQDANNNVFRPSWKVSTVLANFKQNQNLHTNCSTSSKIKFNKSWFGGSKIVTCWPITDKYEANGCISATFCCKTAKIWSLEHNRLITCSWWMHISVSYNTRIYFPPCHQMNKHERTKT